MPDDIVLLTFFTIDAGPPVNDGFLVIVVVNP